MPGLAIAAAFLMGMIVGLIIRDLVERAYDKPDEVRGPHDFE